MTNSAVTGTPPPGARPGKRERLVAAAVQLLYQHGIERTTLADIAAAAHVPAGNVYYYFKTKDEVISAAIDAHVQQIRATLAAIENSHRTPKSRLTALIREFAGQSESIAECGCPLGTLCSELDKRGAESGLDVSVLMRLPIEWAEAQFREIGRRDARDLAFDLLARYEGNALLASTLRDPDVLARAARRIEQWIDAL